MLISALKRGLFSLFTDTRAVHAALEGKSDAELTHIRETFRAQTGRPLERALAAGLKGRDLIRAQLLLQGPAARAKVDALDLEKALKGIADRAQIERVLTDTTDAERALLAREYKLLTGRPLRPELQKLVGAFRDKALALLDRGRLTEVEMLHFATDAATIAQVLAGKSRAEKMQLALVYQARYRVALRLERPDF